MQAAPLKTSILHCPCAGDVAPTGSRCAGQSSPDTGGSSATCLVGVVPCPCQYWPCTVLFCLGCARVHLSLQNYLMANINFNTTFLPFMMNIVSQSLSEYEKVFFFSPPAIESGQHWAKQYIIYCIDLYFPQDLFFLEEHMLFVTVRPLECNS